MATTHTTEARPFPAKYRWQDFPIAWNDSSLVGITWSNVASGVASYDTRPSTTQTPEARP